MRLTGFLSFFFFKVRVRKERLFLEYVSCTCTVLAKGSQSQGTRSAVSLTLGQYTFEVLYFKCSLWWALYFTLHYFLEQVVFGLQRF